MFSININQRSIKTFITACLIIGFAMSALAQKGKARAMFLSMDQTRVAQGKENGYDFEKLKFMYQFRVCDGETQLGIAYEKKATFTKYWKDGKSFTKTDVGAKNWPKPESVRLNEARADLYFGSKKLGVVKLTYIPEFYQGCSGKMFNVLKSLGIDPKQKVYKSDIDKLQLVNVRLVKASIKK